MSDFEDRVAQGGQCYALGPLRPVFDDPDSNWIAPGARIVGDVRIGTGTSVWFGAVIRADNEPMRIGSDSNVQDGSVLHSDPGFPLRIGDEVTIGHGAVVHGCTIRDGVLVGMGATVMNGAEVGENSVVGAGALIPEGVSVPPGSLVLGVPARVVRELGPEERESGRMSAKSYRSRAIRYRETFGPAAAKP